MKRRNRIPTTNVSVLRTEPNRATPLGDVTGTSGRSQSRHRDSPFESGRDATGRKSLRAHREAGQWVRSRVGASVRAMLAVRSAVAGSADGAGLAALLGWQSAVALVWIRRYEAGRFRRLLKGAAAERFVGRLSERATAARGCAIAHAVTQIADVGDIDHLLATPGCLWVVETKYRAVPNGVVAEVLRRISLNVEAVRRWAPPGVPVRGCLVLATAGAPPRKRLYEGGRVEVFDPGSLARRLHHESRKRPDSNDLALARRVWALAGGRERVW